MEQIKDRAMNRCRFYADRDIAYEMKYQNIDVFERNQWAEKMQSWGPNGSLLPFANSSYEWKSLLDDEGIGILCFYDEFWVAAYSYAAGAGANFAQNYYEVCFRPREINKSDLMMFLFKAQCGRPCPRKETVVNMPCVDPACNLSSAFFKNFDEIKDTDDIELPDGTKIKGAEFKKRHDERSDYVKPCINVCKTTVSSKIVCSVFFGCKLENQVINFDGEIIDDTISSFISFLNFMQLNRPEIYKNVLYLNVVSRLENGETAMPDLASNKFYPNQFFEKLKINYCSRDLSEQNYEIYVFSKFEFSSYVDPEGKKFYLVTINKNAQPKLEKKWYSETDPKYCRLMLNKRNLLVGYSALNLSLQTPENTPPEPEKPEQPQNEPVRPSSPGHTPKETSYGTDEDGSESDMECHETRASQA